MRIKERHQSHSIFHNSIHIIKKKIKKCIGTILIFKPFKSYNISEQGLFDFFLLSSSQDGGQLRKIFLGSCIGGLHILPMVKWIRRVEK